MDKFGVNSFLVIAMFSMSNHAGASEVEKQTLRAFSQTKEGKESIVKVKGFLTENMKINPAIVGAISKTLISRTLEYKREGMFLQIALPCNTVSLGITKDF